MWAAWRSHRWMLLGIACLTLMLLVVAAPLLVRGLQQRQLPLGAFRSHGSKQVRGSSSSSQHVDSSGQHLPCAYGALPGTWVESTEPGSRWQLLSRSCQLSNLLAEYAAAVAAGKHGLAAAENGSTVEGSTQQQQLHEEGAAKQQGPPAVRILLLSDSVDRFILQHWCSHLGGVKHTEIMKHAPAHDEQHVPSSTQQQAGEHQHGTGSAGQQQLQEPLASQDASSQQQPSALNKTAYAFHSCHVPGLPSFRLAASYFPGVHPTGPYHRNLQQTYRQRIDAVQAMWRDYASHDPPDIVSVASLLWDIARMRLHEPEVAAGQQLAPEVLHEWVANFTEVVAYARQAFPQTKLWVTHTSLPPRHDPVTGVMAKPYLGRRYHITQLNAAATEAARQLGLQLVDYQQVGDRLMDGQQYLEDLIHPNELVGLELANIYLNLAHQHLAAEGRLGGSWAEAGGTGANTVEDVSIGPSSDAGAAAANGEEGLAVEISTHHEGVSDEVAPAADGTGGNEKEGAAVAPASNANAAAGEPGAVLVAHGSSAAIDAPGRTGNIGSNASSNGTPQRSVVGSGRHRRQLST